MSYINNKNWLSKEYINLYFNTVGTNPTGDEMEFLKDFFDPYNDNEAKQIYYIAIFRLKRGWYKIFVYIFIKIALKKAFKKHEEIDTLIAIHKKFAKKMLNDAIKTYCKISD